MEIPRFKLYSNIHKSELLLEALQNGQLAVGPHLEVFESDLSHTLGLDYVTTASSGFAALFLSIQLQNIKDQNIIVPVASSCTAIPNAVKVSGNRPIFCDLDEATGSLNLHHLSELVKTEEPAMIIQVFHFGIITNYLSNSTYNIPVVEDCAQSVLSDLSRKRPLSVSTRIYSFYPTKGLNAVEGGLICCRTKQEQVTLCKMKYYGGEKMWKEDQSAFNLKMTNLNAVVGLENLKIIDETIARRTLIFCEIERICSSYSSLVTIFPLKINRSEGFVPQKLMIKAISKDVRNSLIGSLKQYGISASTELNLLIDDKEMYGAKNLVDTLFSIPSYEALSDIELEYLMEKLETSIQKWI